MKTVTKMTGTLVLCLGLLAFVSCVSEKVVQNEEVTQKATPSSPRSMVVKSTLIVNGSFPEDARHAHLLSQQGLMSAIAFMTPTPFQFSERGEVSYGTGASFNSFQQKLIDTLKVADQEFRVYEVSFSTIDEGLTGSQVTTSLNLKGVQENITQLLIFKALKESGLKKGRFAVREATLKGDQEASITLWIYK